MPHEASLPSTASGNVLWKWNETDLTQLEEVYKESGNSGSLAVADWDANTGENCLEYSHTSGAPGYTIYRLLDGSGNAVELPRRYIMRAVVGPSRNFAGTNYGTHTNAFIIPFWQDISHHLSVKRSDASSSRLIVWTSNGTTAENYKTFNTVWDVDDYGGIIEVEMNMRIPEAGVTKTGGTYTIYGQSTDHDDLSSGWTGATAPNSEAAWAATWDAPVTPAIGFYEHDLGSGKNFVKDLVILKHPMDQ